MEISVYNQEKLEKRIITIEEYLIQRSFKPGMHLPEKLRMVFHYLPFSSAVRMVMGMMKRFVKRQ